MGFFCAQLTHTSKKVKRNITGQYIPSAPTGGARDRRSEPRSLPSWSLQAKGYQAKPYPLSLFNCASFLGWCVRVLFVEPSLHLTFISQGKASPERRHFKQAPGGAKARSLGRPRSVQGSPVASARAADGQSLEGGSRGDREIVLRRLEVANALRLQSH